MLSRLIITTNRPKGIDVNISSLMQGVMMEFINPVYADYLHNCLRTPYSQYIIYDDNFIYWNILCMDIDSKKNIIDAILEKRPDRIQLKHKETDLNIVRFKEENMSFQELLEATYFGDCSSRVTVEFKTPTAFKVNGKYQFYPTVYHIFNSLINKYDAVSKENTIYSDEIMEQIEKYIEITDYRLMSTYFHMEGVKIKSFKGKITLKIHGPKQFVNLINLLLRFGEYSGVGIKASIGMGAINVDTKERRNRLG